MSTSQNAALCKILIVRPVSGLPVHQDHVSGLIALDICYQLWYMEPNNRHKGKDGWSLRQTGVYHHYDPETKSNTCFLMHPRECSTAQHQISAQFDNAGNTTLCKNDPLDLHILLLSSYLENWQLYINELTEEFKPLVCTIVRQFSPY
jgi:hypothetical protein